MPKPVKKKPATKRRPASDPNRRARQLVAEHMKKLDQGKFAAPMADQPATTAPDVRAIISEHMRKLGAKGGKISGAKRMENLSDRQRKEIAKRAAAVRWRKGR